MGTGSFPGVKYGRGVLLTTHPLLVPRSWKSSAIPTLWATTGPVTGHFTFPYIIDRCLKTLQFHEILVDFPELGDVENRLFDEYLETLNSMGFLDNVSHEKLIM